MEEIENSHPFLSVDAKLECVDVYKFGLPKGTVTEMMVKGENFTDQLCFKRSEFDATGKAIFEKIISDIDWALDLSAKIIAESDNLFTLSRLILNTDVRVLTDVELAGTIEDWAKLRRKVHGLGMPWNYVEFENALFSSHVIKYLEKIIKEKNLALSAPEVFSVLSRPVELSYAQKEEQDMLTLASAIAGGQIGKLEKKERLERHAQKFCWLPYMYLGPAWNKEHFDKSLQDLLNRYNAVELDAQLQAFEKQFEKLFDEQNQIMDSLGLDNLHRKYIKLAQSFLSTKAYRKDAIYHGFYCLEKSFQEAARRLAVTLKQFRMLMSWEVGDAIRNKAADVEELNKRWQYRVIHYNGQEVKILSGNKAKEFFATHSFEEMAVADVTQLNGSCACPGQAIGVVRIINLATEADKMNHGDILVSRATTPDIVAAMKKAAAIITDMGGITCHAAIVSRELGIPCVIGTKIATKVLKDGDRVEVDANKGIIKKI